jgi:hypothetical protein
MNGRKIVGGKKSGKNGGRYPVKDNFYANPL